METEEYGRAARSAPGRGEGFERTFARPISAGPPKHFVHAGSRVLGMAEAEAPRLLLDIEGVLPGMLTEAGHPVGREGS
jgi:hypothetical protein